MSARHSELSSTSGATIDVSLSTIGFYIIFYPAIWSVNSLIGSPLTIASMKLLTGILALSGAYPVVTGDWSLGTLGKYVFAFVCNVILIGILFAFTIGVLHLQIPGTNNYPTILLCGLSYVLSYLTLRFVDS